MRVANVAAIASHKKRFSVGSGQLKFDKFVIKYARESRRAITEIFLNIGIKTNMIFLNLPSKP